MAKTVRFDRRMSDAEGLMWRLDKDPYLSSNVGNISILDRPPDVERFRRRMERATIAVPRLRQRVQPAPVNISAPTWVEDANFDLGFHVRHVALPAPGSPAQLRDFATRFVADPFDRTRPLWEFAIVDGLAGGRSALVQKLHHAVADGEGSIRISLQFLDAERDAPEPPPLQPEHEPVPAPAEPRAVGAVRTVLKGGLRLPLGVLRQAREWAGHPSQIPAAADTIRAIVAQLSDTERARSPLWTRRSLRRQLEVVRVPLDGVKQAAKALGGTLNTAFVTAAASAAGAYHEERGAPVEELRASMAISTRTAESGSNAYTLARLLVPTTPMAVGERFRLIAEASLAARVSSASANLDTLAAVAATLPTSLVARVTRTQSQTVDFATSNIKAAPFPMYIAGARIEENYPMGPLVGVAFNLTLMSYNASLDIGLHVDAGAVDEPERLRRLMEVAFDELFATADPGRAARMRAVNGGPATVRRRPANRS
jgi:diacylglycerol O-acyltransferase